MPKVLVTGSGGREHTLAWKLKQSSSVDEVYCAPGNDGMKVDGVITVPMAGVDQFKDIADFVRENDIDLTVVGPEAPLVDGIVDYFRRSGLPEEGHAIFGPDQSAARLEGSKAFAKMFMEKYGIPTADFKTFSEGGAIDAIRYVEAKGAPIVVKASGLAAGKGSIVCKTLDEALDAIHRIMVKKEFKKAGDVVVIEEFMEGEEASILALTDGKTIRTLVSSQDHKPVFETLEDRMRWIKSGGDTTYKDRDIGPNTGGMGAYAPAPVVTPEVMDKVYKRILEPTIKNMANERNPFTGCLYAGLMIKDGEPSVVEFNVRFGDPEAQPVLSLLENDLYGLLFACTNGTLGKEEYEIKNKDGAALCAVMASGGYPGDYEKGESILGLPTVDDMKYVQVFHAGIKLEDDRYVTNGGRVLGVTGTGNNIKQAINAAYSGVHAISWGNEYYRMDIGERALRR